MSIRSKHKNEWDEIFSGGTTPAEIEAELAAEKAGKKP